VEYVVPQMGEKAIIHHSVTPPYLTACPEVTYHKLRSKDSFIIIGSDGLWDMLSPSQAVRLVGEHMSGKTVLNPYTLPKGKGRTEVDVKLGTIHETLMKRMEASKLKPIDSNAATHLIRHALSGADYGLDPNRLSYYLTIPEDTVRLFRDDITATVVFFDFDYLSQRPL
jgi:pyruvate dehydrogenase phosphatase